MFSKESIEKARAQQALLEQQKKEQQEKKAAEKENKKRDELETQRIELSDGTNVFILSIPIVISMLPGALVKAKIDSLKIAYPTLKLVDIDIHTSPEKSVGAGHIILTVRMQRSDRV